MAGIPTDVAWRVYYIINNTDDLVPVFDFDGGTDYLLTEEALPAYVNGISAKWFLDSQLTIPATVGTDVESYLDDSYEPFILTLYGKYEIKYLDQQGLQFLWSKISMQDYPNNETLISVINAIDETKADKTDIKQSDWTQNDDSANDFIKNKPFDSFITYETTFNDIATFSPTIISGETEKLDAYHFRSILASNATGAKITIDNNSYYVEQYTKLSVVINNSEATIECNRWGLEFAIIILSLVDLSGINIVIDSAVETINSLDDKYLSDNIARTQQIPDITNLATKDEISNLATKDEISNLATKDEISNLATKDEIVTDYNQLTNRPIYCDTTINWLIESQLLENNTITLELSEPLQEDNWYEIMLHSEFTNYPIYPLINEDDSNILYLTLNGYNIDITISCNTIALENGLYLYTIESSLNDTIDLKHIIHDIRKLDERCLPDNVARTWEIPAIDTTLSVSGAAADAKATGDAIAAINIVITDEECEELLTLLNTDGGI